MNQGFRVSKHSRLFSASALAITLLGSSALAGCTSDADGSGDTIRLMTIASVGTSLQNLPDVEAGAKQR